MNKIEKIYIGAFAVKTNGEPIETIMNGFQNLEDGSVQVRGSFEHEINAVPSLIEFCDLIAGKLGCEWRLLKFEHGEEISKETVEEYRSLCSCKGACH